jgi:phosphoribosylformylglycinamidine synthase
LWSSTGARSSPICPSRELGDEAPLYDRPHHAKHLRADARAESIEAPISNADALRQLIASPDLASKRWIWEQYDQFIGGNTVSGPGGDAAIVRVEDGPKGLALTTDVTPRYLRGRPGRGRPAGRRGGLAQHHGGRGLPLALTDNLNFGNPERPEAMGQLVGCIRGIGEAARALDFPIVSGNVSLYNETNGRGILPTPTIGGVGLVDDVAVRASIAFKRSGDAVLLLGETRGWLGQSVYLREVCGREEGAPPHVDLGAERRNGDFVRGLIRSGEVDTVHDCSDGGVAVALAEMAMMSGIGITIQDRDAPSALPRHAFLFGEDGARYILTCPGASMYDLRRRASDSGVPTWYLGTTGGDAVVLPGETPVSIAELESLHEGWLPGYMAGATQNDDREAET